MYTLQVYLYHPYQIFFGQDVLVTSAAVIVSSSISVSLAAGCQTQKAYVQLKIPVYPSFLDSLSIFTFLSGWLIKYQNPLAVFVLFSPPPTNVNHRLAIAPASCVKRPLFMWLISYLEIWKVVSYWINPLIHLGSVLSTLIDKQVSNRNFSLALPFLFSSGDAGNWIWDLPLWS